MEFKCTILIVDEKGHVVEHVDTNLYDEDMGGSDAAWSEARRQMDELMEED